ncbi:MAG: beta propeller repeat protein [Acidimicrobiales bacterium]
MRSAPPRVRTSWQIVATFAAAALVLAGCGAANVAAQRVDGTPARSISVPLTNVGCTLSDFCVAVGTSSASVGPTSVAEFVTPAGNWFPLSLPATASPLVTSTACTKTQCLVGGSQPGRDLLWLFSAIGHSLAVATPPPGGRGVDALTCHEINCALVDTGAVGAVPRFSLSADGGLTWTEPIAMAWASGDAVTSLACGTAFDCVVSALTPHHQVSLYATRDGGTTWTQRSTPSTWTALTSISCAKIHCVALASVAGASKVVRSSNLGTSWTSASLKQQSNALACVTLTSCVVVGQLADATPWLATLRAGITNNVSLRYVPTPLLDVACGTKRCAAIGVTTVLSVPAPG